MPNNVKQIANIQNNFINGSKVVGVTAVQVSATSFPTNSGVLIKAASTNSAKVYVGSSSDVSINFAASTDGFELSAGEGILIEVDNVNKVYAIAAAANQRVYWLSL